MENNRNGKSLLESALAMLESELLEIQTERDRIEESLKAQLAPLNRRIHDIEAAVRYQRDALENYGGTASLKPQTGNSGTSKIADLAYFELSSGSIPVHYRELASRLLSKGAALTAKDTGTMLINYLRREPERFCRTSKPGFYALLEWNLPDSRPVAGGSRTTTRKRTKPRASARNSRKGGIK